MSEREVSIYLSHLLMYHSPKTQHLIKSCFSSTSDSFVNTQFHIINPFVLKTQQCGRLDCCYQQLQVHSGEECVCTSWLVHRVCFGE